MNAKEFEKIRENIGWTKRELAKRLGVHERTIYGYLKEDVNIPLTIQKLLVAYKDGYRPKDG